MSSEFILLHRSTSKNELFAILGLTLLLALVRINALIHLGTDYLGGFEGDGGLYVWLTKSNIRDLFNLPWFNTSAFYPYTRSLAWSDNFILPSFAILLLMKLGAPLLIAYNLILLFANLLNGYLTYCLSYRLTGKPLPSFLAGAGFMVSGCLTANLGHPQLQFVFFVPLALLALFSYLAKPHFLRAALIGLVILFCFLTTVYYAIFSTIAILSVWVGAIILRPRHFKRREYILFFTGFLCGVCPIALFLSPYLDVRRTFNERGIYEAYYFSANILSYLSTSSHQLVYGWTSRWSHDEAHLFPGFVILVATVFALKRLTEAKQLKPYAATVAATFSIACLFSANILPPPYSKYVAALALWACLVSLGLLIYRMGLLEQKLGFTIITNRGLICIFALTAFIFFALSFGPLGNPEKGDLAFGVFRLYYELFPGFNSIRAIGRAGSICLFCLSILSAFSFVHLLERSKHSTLIVSVALILIFLENFSFQIPLQPETGQPPVFDELRELLVQENEAIIVLPFTETLDKNGRVQSWGEFARLNTNYMHWVFNSKLRLVNGYSGQRSNIMEEFPRKLAQFPDSRSMSVLNSITGLRYVIYIPKFNPHFDRGEFLNKVATWQSFLKPIETHDAENFLFEFLPGIRIDKDTSLLVPSYPQGTLHIDLMTLNKKISPEVSLDILLRDHFGDKPIATARLNANGLWETFNITIPSTPDRVRPLKVTFRGDDNEKIFLGKSRFQWNTHSLVEQK